MTDPINVSTYKNPIGRFMVAVGAVMELSHTGKILLVRRHSSLDWRPGEWEICYGRIAQLESPEDGLRREVREELGIERFEIFETVRVWHIYRGSEKPENELVGITYRCRTEQEAVVISDEHEEYRWVTSTEALAIITTDGIRNDIEAYINLNQ